MARNLYVGGTNKQSRPIRTAYIGINNQARKIKKIYVGVDNQARLVANAAASAYTITYNANGGSGSMAATYAQGGLSSSLAGVTATLASCSFSRSGYRFLGWNTAADGSGTIYTNRQSVYLTGNLTLYAIWVQVLTFTYDKTKDLSKIQNLDSLISWSSDVFTYGPASNVACTVTIPSWVAAYGGWSTGVDLGWGYKIDDGARSFEMPYGSVVAVAASNHYTGSSDYDAYNHCDIYRNGAPATSGSGTSSGTDVYWQFTATTNTSIDFQWDAQGLPWVNWPARMGSSWWDITINT